MPPAHPSSARARARLAPLAVLLAVTGLLAGCGTSTARPGATAQDAAPSVVAGSLTLSGARVPLPASPDVGVAYFTLTNAGSSVDRLVQARSPQARSVMPMKDVTHAGASTMVPVGALRVPAHGQTLLQPGGLHLMLQGLTQQLRVGDRVTLRLTFAHAGMIDVVIPVTPLLSESDRPTDMVSMPGM